MHNWLWTTYWPTVRKKLSCFYLDDFAARIKAKSAATKKPAAKKLNNADDLFDSMLGEEDKKKPAASKLPAAPKPAAKPAAAKRPKVTDSDLDDMDSDGSADYKPKKVPKQTKGGGGCATFWNQN